MKTAELPTGYDFTDQHAISAEEVVALRDAGNWGTETNLELWDNILSQSLATVGVRDIQKSLIGIGFLAGNNRHAVLCDFNVHPDHRGRGIGKAILLRRMEIATEMNIPYMYTELAPTNPLRSMYEELGFVATGNVYSRATRRHPSESAPITL